MTIDLTDAVVERFARAHWNANPTAERSVMWPMGETGVSRRVVSHVLWDDEDMRETDRQLWREKTLAAFHAIISPEADANR